MFQLDARTKKEKSIRNAYIIATAGVLVFFPAVYLGIRDKMPTGGA